MLSYDEVAVRSRLAVLPRVAKTAFAAACAQRLVPAFDRYASAVQFADPDALTSVLNATWETVRTGDGDLSAMQAQAEDLVPTDGGEWIPELAYGQNSAAAAAYAVRTWVTDDPQEAAWAARQVYEAADYAALAAAPQLDLNAPETESILRSSPQVQLALAGIEADLRQAERSDDWEALRARATSEGREWARSLP